MSAAFLVPVFEALKNSSIVFWVPWLLLLLLLVLVRIFRKFLGPVVRDAPPFPNLPPQPASVHHSLIGFFHSLAPPCLCPALPRSLLFARFYPSGGVFGWVKYIFTFGFFCRLFAFCNPDIQGISGSRMRGRLVSLRLGS